MHREDQAVSPHRHESRTFPNGPLEHVIQVMILKKETIYIHLESAQLKDQMLREFAECREAAMSTCMYESWRIHDLTRSSESQ